MDPEAAKRHTVPPEYFEYTQRDAIIYAMGIGCRAKEDIRYLYEGHEEFMPIPTYVVAPGFAAQSLMDWPGIEFDLTRILHGEQYIEVYDKFPSDGKLRSECKVVDILDKGSGALIVSEVITYDDATGKKLAMQQFGTFQIGSGKFGGPKSSPHVKEPATVPQRNPDKVIEEKTSVDQAALYRLGSLDVNPLHIDPNFAKMSGFKNGPILHGLCSLGFATRHVIMGYADNDFSKFKAVKVRFSSPVMPGQTLSTEMWKEGSRVVFQVKVKETGKVVISNGYVELTGSPSPPSSPKMTLKSAELFAQIGRELPNNKDAVKKVNGIVLYDITQGGKPAAKWTLDLKTGAGSIYEGEPKDGAKATVTMTVDDEDFVKIASGQLDPTKAFMGGKIKAKGNIMMLQKLQGILKGAGKAKL